MEYVSDFLWSYQAWCVRHSIKSWTMLIINLAGWVLGRTNGLPCDFWRFTGAWSSITMGQNYIRTTSGAWNGSMATIVWNHPRFVTILCLFLTSTWTVFSPSTQSGWVLINIWFIKYLNLQNMFPFSFKISQSSSMSHSYSSLWLPYCLPTVCQIRETCQACWWPVVSFTNLLSSEAGNRGLVTLNVFTIVIIDWLSMLPYNIQYTIYSIHGVLSLRVMTTLIITGSNLIFVIFSHQSNLRPVLHGKVKSAFTNLQQNCLTTKKQKWPVTGCKDNAVDEYHVLDRVDQDEPK